MHPPQLPVAHHITVAAKDYISVADTLPPYIPSLCPLVKDDALAVLCVSSDKMLLFCLHLGTGNFGWVKKDAVIVLVEDLSKPNPYLYLALQYSNSNPSLPNTNNNNFQITLTPPIVPGQKHSIGPIRSISRSTLPPPPTVKIEPSSSPNPPPSPAFSISSESSGNSKNASDSDTKPTHRLAPPPATRPGGPRKRVRDPRWDKKYEEKRKAEGKRGHGANLLKDQQNRCTKPFPNSIDGLLTLLIDAQPAGMEAESHVLVFSEASLGAARNHILSYDQKSWRVWMPDPVWNRFNILKMRCCPPGTTVAEFVEMMLDFAGRTEEIKDGVGPNGLNTAMLERKLSMQLSVRAAIALSGTVDVVGELWNDSPVRNGETPPMGSPSDHSQTHSDSPAQSGVDGLSNSDIIAYLHSMENEVMASIIDTPPNGFGQDPFNINIFGDLSPVSGLQTTDDIAKLLAVDVNSIGMGGVGGGLASAYPPIISPAFSVMDSPPSLNSTSPQVDAFSVFGSPTSSYQRTPTNGVSTYSPNYTDLNAVNLNGMNFNFMPPLNVQHIAPFDPTTSPEYKDFTPLPWQPPSLPGEINRQHQHHPSSSSFLPRFHPYDVTSLRNVTQPSLFSPRSASPYGGDSIKQAAAAAALDAIYVKQTDDGDDEVVIGQVQARAMAAQGAKVVHWASLYGPGDWEERSLEEPPSCAAAVYQREMEGKTPLRPRSRSVSSNSSGRLRGSPVSGMRGDEMSEQAVYEAMGEMRAVPESVDDPMEDVTPEGRQRRNMIDRAFTSFKTMFSGSSSSQQESLYSSAQPRFTPSPDSAMRQQSLPTAYAPSSAPLASSASFAPPGVPAPPQPAAPAAPASKNKRSLGFAGRRATAPALSLPSVEPTTTTKKTTTFSLFSRRTTGAVAKPVLGAREVQSPTKGLAAFPEVEREGEEVRDLGEVGKKVSEEKGGKEVEKARKRATPPAKKVEDVSRSEGGVEAKTKEADEVELEEKEEKQIDEQVVLLERVVTSESDIGAATATVRAVDRIAEMLGGISIEDDERPVVKIGSGNDVGAAAGVLAVMRLMRPFAFSRVKEEVGEERKRIFGRVAVTVGIVERLVEVGRVDEGVVTACSKQVLATYPSEPHPAVLALMARLVARGLLDGSWEEDEDDEETLTGESEFEEGELDGGFESDLKGSVEVLNVGM